MIRSEPGRYNAQDPRMPSLRSRRLVIAVSALAIVAATTAVTFMYPGFPWLVPLVGGFLVLHTIYGLASLGTMEIPERRVAVRDRTDDGVAEMDATAEMLRDVDMFRGLPNVHLRAIAALGHRRWLPQGASLGVEGRIGNALYVVLRGRAELSANSSVGRITVRVAGPGESFPLAALLGDGMLITSVQAMTPVVVWQVDPRRLSEYCDEHPDAGTAIYAAAASILGDRYRKTLARLKQADADRSTAEVMADESTWANV